MKMKTTNVKNGCDSAPNLNSVLSQLELGIGNPELCRSNRHPKRRASRANWWFNRMRQIVDLATDWQSPPPPRPQQTFLPNTHREPLATATAASPTEQQLSE